MKRLHLDIFYKITFRKMSELFVLLVLQSIKFLDMFVNFSIKNILAFYKTLILGCPRH